MSEVVQRIVKTVALITMSQSVRAWKELGGDLQTRKAVSKLINVVENAGWIQRNLSRFSSEIDLRKKKSLLHWLSFSMTWPKFLIKDLIWNFLFFLFPKRTSFA